MGSDPIFRVIGRAAAAALFVLLTACGPRQAGDASALARPEVQPGDSWMYRTADRLTGDPETLYGVRVTFADAKVIHGVVTWQDEPESDSTWTAEWNSITSASDGLGLNDRMGLFDPHGGFLRFPLPERATWTSTVHLRLPRRGFYETRYERTVTTEGYEEVVVPAGKFRALKVIATGTFERMDIAPRQFGMSTSGSTHTVFWYVPEVKRWVKFVHQELGTASAGARALVHREDELVFFTVR